VVLLLRPERNTIGAHSAREIYTAGATAGAVDIDFTYCKNAFDGPLKSLPQKGSSWFGDKPSAWKVSPFWPIKMPYLVIDLSKAELDKDDAWFVVGYPSRAYVWIMARQPKMDDKVYEDISKRLVEVHHYPAGLPDLVRVPHQWTEAVGADGKPTYERSAK